MNTMTAETAPRTGKRRQKSYLSNRRRWLAALRDMAHPGRGANSASTLSADPNAPPPFRSGADTAPHTGDTGAAAYAGPYLHRVAARLRGPIAAAGLTVPGLADQEIAIRKAISVRFQLAAHQAFALAINVKRVRGELSGASAEERSKAFQASLLEPGGRDYWAARFPVLEETFAHIADNAVAAWSEFLVRISEDWAEFAMLLPSPPRRVLSLHGYAGDPHNGGRSVIIVVTDVGSVVYKPRQLDTDRAFAAALNWLSARTALDVRHFRLLDRSTYGWTEFVIASDCQTDAGVGRCYERSGMLLGTLFVLGGGDVHYENIICAGEHPFVVDIESLLTGPLNADTARDRARQRARIETLMNTCYLPCLMPVGDGFMDVTGAGYRAGQEITFSNRLPVELDEKVVAGTVSMISYPSPNIPTIGGTPSTSADYVAHIEAGFAAAMQAFLEHGADFLARVLPDFRTTCSRFIPRATIQYAETVRKSCHPHACVDRAAHDRVISALANDLPWSSRASRLILCAEIAAIRQADIPFFKSQCSSTSIWTSDGTEIRGIFQQSGYDSIVGRLKRLSRTEIARQLDVIRLSFSASRGRVSHGGSVVQALPFDAGIVRDTARQIGDRLLATAISSGRGLHWMGRTMMGKRFSVALASSDLYGGEAGIGIFFAELYRHTRLRRHRRAAMACLSSVRTSFATQDTVFGTFEGLAGLLYAEILIARSLGVPNAPYLATHLETLSQQVEGDRTLDLIGGAAGVLLVALRARSLPFLTSAADDLAHRCCDHLLNEAARADDIVHWPNSAFPVPLTGFAHGSCGIALALAEYAAVHDRNDLWPLVDQAFAHADESFCEARGLWKDLRTEDGFMNAWCHGAAGMTLARARVLELAPAGMCPTASRQLDVGLALLLREAPHTADTVCHGRSGNWEAMWRGTQEHRDIAARQVMDLCARWRKGETLKGDLAHPTPDLMNGLAGIGLQLLRSFDANVPSVLLLGD